MFSLLKRYKNHHAYKYVKLMQITNESLHVQSLQVISSIYSTALVHTHTRSTGWRRCHRRTLRDDSMMKSRLAVHPQTGSPLSLRGDCGRGKREEGWTIENLLGEGRRRALHPGGNCFGGRPICFYLAPGCRASLTLALA